MEMDMKCTANRNCQVRNSQGTAVFYHQGDMEDFEECPPNWTPVEDAKVVMIGGNSVIDFSQLKDDVIRALDFDSIDLKEYMKVHLPETTWAANIGHNTLVEKYLYARGANQERTEVLESFASPALDPVATAESLQATTEVVETDDLDSLLGE